MKSFGRRNYQLEYKKREGAYAIVQDKSNNFLVVADKENNYYLIGGGIKKQETPIQAIHREALEETGYKINVLEFFGKSEKHWVSEKYPKWSQHNIGIFYECELNGKVTKPIEQEMILWVTYAELRTKLFHEHHLYIIDRYLDIQGYF